MQYEIPGAMAERLERDFTYHAPNQDQIPRYEGIRDAAKIFARALVKATPPSREQSLALTALDEVVFWSNAAIARNEGT